MNLGPPAASPTSHRSYQAGRARGTKAGKPVIVSVEWLVDTGADIGVVRKSVGDSFDLTATGASASPTTGGGGILVKTGLQVEFTAEDTHGISHTLLASRPVGVKSNNSPSDVLGMDQLASLNVTVNWEPAARTGALQIRVPPPPATSVTAGAATFQAPLGPRPVIIDHGTWLDVAGIRVEKRLWGSLGSSPVGLNRRGR